MDALQLVPPSPTNASQLVGHMVGQKWDIVIVYILNAYGINYCYIANVVLLLKSWDLLTYLPFLDALRKETLNGSINCGCWEH